MLPSWASSTGSGGPVEEVKLLSLLLVVETPPLAASKGADVTIIVALVVELACRSALSVGTVGATDGLGAGVVDFVSVSLPTALRLHPADVVAVLATVVVVVVVVVVV